MPRPMPRELPVIRACFPLCAMSDLPSRRYAPRVASLVDQPTRATSYRYSTPKVQGLDGAVRSYVEYLYEVARLVDQPTRATSYRYSTYARTAPSKPWTLGVADSMR